MTYYRDADGDGFGNLTDIVMACTPPDGYIVDSTDCDDADADVYPGAEELCNEIDDNCDGTIDNVSGVPVITYDDGIPNFSWEGAWFYIDADGDGYGSFNVSIIACQAPDGYVESKTDCDDSSSDVHPDATEVCNGIDDNCSGSVDDITDAEGTTYYRDADSDGFGTPNDTIIDCAAPSGYVEDNTDCDDTSSSIHPDAVEVCNGMDDNCSGSVDDVEDAEMLFKDSDGDGFGDPYTSWIGCPPDDSWVNNDADCDDSDPLTTYAGTQCVQDVCSGTLTSTCSCDAAVVEYYWPLTYLNAPWGNTSTSLSFDPPVHNPRFTLRNIGWKTGKYHEKVTVTYTYDNGASTGSVVMTGQDLDLIQTSNNWDVVIDTENVTSMKVKLDNIVEAVSGIIPKNAKVGTNLPIQVCE